MISCVENFSLGFNRVGKITYFGLNKSWENHILWPKTEGLGFQNVFSSQTWKVRPRGQTPNSYSPTCHQVVFESLPRLSQYLRISPGISSGDPEWSLPMPRELGQRFGKLSFDSATWKDIWSIVTKYCLQLYYLSLLSVTIPVLDKEKTRHFLPNFSNVTEMEQNPQITNSAFVSKTMKNVKQPNSRTQISYMVT